MLTTLFFGFLVSFLGQLPLGNMSFTATQVGLQEGFKKAWQFAIGVAIIEMIYLRFALIGMDWVVMHRMVFLGLGWLTVVLFLVLGIMAFITARKQQTEKKKLPRLPRVQGKGRTGEEQNKRRKQNHVRQTTTQKRNRTEVQ